jgi:hypothetical protein
MVFGGVEKSRVGHEGRNRKVTASIKTAGGTSSEPATCPAGHLWLGAQCRSAGRQSLIGGAATSTRMPTRSSRGGKWRDCRAARIRLERDSVELAKFARISTRS